MPTNLKFSIKVYDLPTKFFVLVFAHINKEVAHLSWYGGDFTYQGIEYVLRGPYHGLREYTIFRLTPIEVEIEHVTN